MIMNKTVIMTDQYLQDVNERKVIIQEMLGEPICECIILCDKLTNLKQSNEDTSEQQTEIRNQIDDILTTIKYIIYP